MRIDDYQQQKLKVYRDNTPAVSLDLRDTQRGVRVTNQDQYSTYTLDDSGDEAGWQFWPSATVLGRGFGSWSQAVPCVVVNGGTHIRPILDTGLGADTSYEVKEIVTVGAANDNTKARLCTNTSPLPTLVGGEVGICVQCLNQDAYENCFFLSSSGSGSTPCPPCPGEIPIGYWLMGYDRGDINDADGRYLRAIETIPVKDSFHIPSLATSPGLHTVGSVGNYKCVYPVHAVSIPDAHDPGAGSYTLEAYDTFTLSASVSVSNVERLDLLTSKFTTASPHGLSVGDVALFKDTYYVNDVFGRASAGGGDTILGGYVYVTQVLSPTEFETTSLTSTNFWQSPENGGSYLLDPAYPFPVTGTLQKATWGALLHENSNSEYDSSFGVGNAVLFEAAGTGVSPKNKITGVSYTALLHDEGTLGSPVAALRYMRVLDSLGRHSYGHEQAQYAALALMQEYPLWYLETITLPAEFYASYDVGSDTSDDDYHVSFGTHCAVRAAYPHMGFNDEATAWLLFPGFFTGDPFPKGNIPGWPAGTLANPGWWSYYYPKVVSFVGNPTRMFQGGLIHTSKHFSNWRFWDETLIPPAWRDVVAGDITGAPSFDGFTYKKINGNGTWPGAMRVADNTGGVYRLASLGNIGGANGGDIRIYK